MAVARAVTVPLLMAVTSPEELIVASPVPLVTDHVTDLFVAFAGKILAVNCNVPLSDVMTDVPPAPVTEIPVTGIIWLLMVMTSVPKIPDPSLAVARAVTVPLLIAVTRPEPLIVADPVPLARDHVIVLIVAS